MDKKGIISTQIIVTPQYQFHTQSILQKVAVVAIALLVILRKIIQVSLRQNPFDNRSS